MAATALMLIGAWNVSTNLFALLSGSAGFDLFWGVLGLFQIFWGVKMLGPNSRLAAVRLSKPPSDIVAEIDRLARILRRAGEKNGEEFIEFTCADFQAKHFYHGKLMEGAVFLTEGSGTHLHFLRPEDLEVTFVGKKLRRKKNSVKVRMRREELKGLMSETSLERINRWKAVEADMACRGVQ